MGETVRIINFKNNSDKAKVSEKSKKIIKELMETAGITEITITSTARNANEQARAMYNNLEAEGAESQKKLYGSAGDKIIDTYIESKKAEKKQVQIIVDMGILHFPLYTSCKLK
ncbi:MAG: hypothetical protein GY737_04815 [Desulfobacteraceae bacterium]|nr:hypothetical protein [Desulfobacteraceae bacterium]